MRYAIITPYHQEPQHWLERCIRSVREQTTAADHIMVADGLPQDWIDGTGVRHLRLDRAHGDFGNAARGLGAMVAVAEQYDGIGLLDADNWLEPGHVAACVATFDAASAGDGADYVIARRHLRRPDETILPITDEQVEQHVDTSCYFFFPGAYHLLPYFGIMPKALSAIGDRVFYDVLRHRGLRSATCTEITVNYHCLWQQAYLAAGEPPPAGAKPNIDADAVKAWFRALRPEEQRLIQRLSGIVP